MRKLFCLCMLVFTAVMFGCGGSSDAGKKASVNGVVAFPAPAAAKRVAADAIASPRLVITDLDGNTVATPVLTVDPLDARRFSYAADLDPAQNYVFTASWGGQVLRGMADQSTLSTLNAVLDISPTSTAAVLLAEEQLNIAPGALGTSASHVTATQFVEIKPAALVLATEAGATTTYAPLIAEVNNALSSMQDPSSVTAVTVAAETVKSSYSAPESFTLAMVSGKSFQTDSGSTITLGANGTVTTSKNSNSNSWKLNADGTILISYMDQSTSTAGWDVITLLSGSPTALVVSDRNINGSTWGSTWTYFTPAASGFTTAMLSGKVFTEGEANTIKFFANGVFTTTDSQDSLTWSVNASGQVVVRNSTDNTSTIVTLVSGDLASGFHVSLLDSDGTSGTSTIAVKSLKSIIGTWGGDGTASNTVVFTFVDSTHFMMAQAGASDSGGHTGLEFGTYTWDATTGTGAFSAKPLFDTNGDWGSSNPPAGTTYTISVNGDTLTVNNSVEGAHQISRLQASATNPLVGGWWAPFTDISGKAGGVLVTFLDDTHFLLAQAGNPDADTTGTSGIELGTYSVGTNNAITTVFAADTNGDWGLSHPPEGSRYSVAVSGTKLTVSNPIEGDHVAERVQ